MHPPSETLARFVEGSLSEAERVEVTAELARCAECRAIVGELARGAPPQGAAIPRTIERAKDDDAPFEALPPGADIAGRYRVLRRLGEGGMGVVYEVEHTLLGRTFALKTLHAAMAARSDAVRRFLGEARALAALGHEGIVEVIDVGSDEAGTPFLVMPLLAGETLEALLERERTLSIELAMRLSEDIARALAFAHGKSVVHRDIKPANIFLVGEPGGEGPRVKLLDFGIAKLLDVDATRTGTGVLLGTPRYMAPEQWSRPREVDARVDVFAWGVTAYRMLAGELPYAWGDVMEGRRAEVPDLRALRPDAPIALVALIERCLALDARKRPIDARELVASLASARPQRSSIRPPAGPEGAPPSVRPIVGRDAELARVLALARTPRPVWIVGREGIGKTTLLDAVARELRASGKEVLIVRGKGSPSHLPYAALRSVLATSEGPLTEEALGLALRTTLGRDEVALLVDDAEALDARSHALLAAIGAGAPHGPVFVGTRRELRDDDDRGTLDAEAVALEGVGPEAVRALMSEAGPTDDASVERMCARTGGNPLFVLQCLALEAASVAEDDDAPTSPRALTEAIVSRLEAAPDHAAIAWQIAAVLSTFPGAISTARDLAALGAPRADEALAWLVGARVLEPVAAGAVEHRFCSDVLGAAVLSAIGEAGRRELHRTAALLRGRGLAVGAEARRWAEVAHHLERASERTRASDAFARAVLGTRAIPLVPPEAEAPADVHALAGPAMGTRQDLSFEAAVRWAERARSLAAAEGLTRQDDDELALVEVEALAARGRFAEVVARIEALLPRVSGLTRARALVHLGTALQRSGEGARALEVLARALEVARAEAEGPARNAVLALAMGRCAVGLAFAGKVDDARDLLAEAEPLVLTDCTELRPDLAGWRAQISGISGDLGERREAYWAAVELFRASGNVRFAAFSLLNLGDTYARLGAYEEAERALRRAHDECEALGATVMTGYAAINLAQTLGRLGRRAEAASWVERARELAVRTGEPRLSRYVTLYAAMIATLADAEREPGLPAIGALAAIVPSEGLGELDASFVVQALTVLARASLQRGDTAGALVQAARAKEILDDAGGLEEGEPELHLVLADALAADGKSREARDVLQDGARKVKAAARRIAGAIFRGHYLEDVTAHRELLLRSSA
jgi:serine/threonine-protein kinase